MESIIKFESKPELDSPAFIECLPGVGNVGKIAGEFLADHADAVKFASLYSENFPAQIMSDQDCVAKPACNELWYGRLNGRDVVFLKGDYQCISTEGQYAVCKEIFDILTDLGVTNIITLGGYGTGKIVEDVHVYGTVSKKELRNGLEDIGVTFSPGEPGAGIVGAAGLLVGFGKIFDIDSVCFMGETAGFYEDHTAALAVVKVLKKYFGIKELDLTALVEKADEISKITKKALEEGNADNKADLSYIG